MNEASLVYLLLLIILMIMLMLVNLVVPLNIVSLRNMAILVNLRNLVIFVIRGRVAEVGVLAETAKYPSMLARSARLQIFATKNTVFYNCKFLQHKHRFLR